MVRFAMLAVAFASAPAHGGEPDPCRTRAGLYARPGERTGNCIFSTRPLPRCREDGYADVRDRFTAGTDTTLRSRCYWLRPWKELSLENEKRGWKFVRYSVRLAVDNAEFSNVAALHFQGPPDPDQSSSLHELLPDGPDRRFTKFRYEDEAARRAGSHKICVTDTYDVVVGQQKGASPKSGSLREEREKDDVRTLTLAESCFTWIVPGQPTAPK